MCSITLEYTKLDVPFGTDNQRTKHFNSFCKSEELGYVKKSQNWTFKVNFLFQKSSESFYFFSMKNKSLGAHFLFKWFFGNFNFKTPLLLRSCPIFDETQLHRFALSSGYQYHMQHLILPTSEVMLTKYVPSLKLTARFFSYKFK